MKRKYSESAYYLAQSNLGILFHIYIKDLKRAIHHYNNVKKPLENDHRNTQLAYAKSQWNLGNIYQCKIKNIHKALKHYRNIQKYHSETHYEKAQKQIEKLTTP